MGKGGDGILSTALFHQALQLWSRAARQAPTTKLSVLRKQNNRARQLKAQLDQLIHTADERLAMPMIGSAGFAKPHDADWAWRPDLWRGPLPVRGMSSVATKSMLGEEVTLFHDCSRSELTLRQIRNIREMDLAPFGLRMDVFRFDGSFLSVVIDLPKDAVDGLKRSHLLRMISVVEVEKPLEIFARLNVRHGPNTEQIVRELDLAGDEIVVEFDLAYSNMNEKRIEKAWVDLIFESPEMNQVTLRDLTFSRRPRARL
jgi:hypothetical protein